jgi:hypothetical protein
MFMGIAVLYYLSGIAQKFSPVPGWTYMRVPEQQAKMRIAKKMAGGGEVKA